MSFDDFANHIYQKHRLAVALALIRSKPTSVRTDNYLEDLKSKIVDKMDDDNFSVCSDDFMMEDDDQTNDSVTILKDFDPEYINNVNNFLGDDYEARKKHSNAPQMIDRKISENLSQITYYDSSQTEFPTNITDIMLSQHNHNINQNANELTISENVVSEDFNDRKRIVDENTVIENTSTYKTYSKENNNETVGLNCKPVAASTQSMDETYYDSQKTQLYTVHGFTQNYTHYSPSQNDIVIPNKYLYGNNKNKKVSTVPNEDINEESNTAAVNVNDCDNETRFVSKGNSKIDENPTNRRQFEYIQTMNTFSQHNDNNYNEIQYNNANFNSESNKTINYINNIINKDTESTNIQNTTKFSQNVNQHFDEMQCIEENVNRNSFPTQKDINKNGGNREIVDMEITNEPHRFNQNFYHLLQNREISYNKNKFKKAIDTSKAKDVNQLTKESNTGNLAQNSEKKYQFTPVASGNDSSDQTTERREEEEEYDSEEIISYKVLEEFNKVKSFLNRQNRRMSCDGYSTDSGYRSDSQRSNYRSALQLSGNWLNQSGCSLFTYIMQCPLVGSTRDITNEIAQVLSQLIDRLHEEEQYPSFLEDLLETVDLLLRQLYEGESSEDNEFLKYDETIQRILLLNKSIHIQKHSIEKMSNILESFHSKVTEANSTYELTNIDQIENITYIFHILEILLKNYLKKREILSQCSTQNSQDDGRVFKKSSITDIWRKKWNPIQNVFEGSREKKCILKSCSDILNRIVVDCVSSYSLIAYSALKCFNSMQT